MLNVQEAAYKWLLCIGVLHDDILKIERDGFSLWDLLGVCEEEALALLPVSEAQAQSIARCGSCSAPSAHLDSSR